MSWDASGTELGCVFMQDNRVIAYASRALRNREKNYPTHDLELAAVIHALKLWRHHLLGTHCNIYTVLTLLRAPDLYTASAQFV